MVPFIKASIFKIIEITDSIQLANGKYFSVIDLTNTFGSVPISKASHPQFAFIS